MAYISELKKTKDGRRYWAIRVSRGRDSSRMETRFYWPEKKNGDPVSEKKALNDRDAFAADFENRVKAGEVVSRKEAAEQKAVEDRRRAELKTVKQYAEGVWMAKKKLVLAENTREDYQAILDNTIYPAIGDELLVDITAARLNKLLLDFQSSGRSVSFARQVRVVLNGIFSSAYNDDSIPQPIMLKVDKPKKSKDDVVIPESEKTLSLDMLNYVLDCVSLEPLKWQVYINLMADTGARRGEITGLQWADVDFSGSCVAFFHNVQYTKQKGIYYTTPKNDRKRVVDVGKETLDLLTEWKKAQEAEAKEQEKKTGVLCVSPWVFNQDGTPEVMHPTSPTWFFRKFGERYRIENFHPHLLRHTSASLAITEAGADIVSVSQRLGHSDTAVTLRMYSHASADSVKRAGQGVRNALKRARKKKEKKKAEGGEG